MTQACFQGFSENLWRKTPHKQCLTYIDKKQHSVSSQIVVTTVQVEGGRGKGLIGYTGFYGAKSLEGHDTSREVKGKNTPAIVYIQIRNRDRRKKKKLSLTMHLNSPLIRNKLNHIRWIWLTQMWQNIIRTICYMRYFFKFRNCANIKIESQHNDSRSIKKDVIIFSFI